MKVFSGKCCLCDVGFPSGIKDFRTGDELYTGDIVLLYSVDYPNTDIEHWNCHGMTIIVADQYTSYTTGVITPNQTPFKPFCMGVKCVDFPSKQWKVQLIKSFKDVVDGEHFPSYGFSYKTLQLENNM